MVDTIWFQSKGKRKGSGWKGESRRHSLARKGVKTTPMNSMGKKQRFLKNSGGKRVFTGNVSSKLLNFIMEHENEIDFKIPYEQRKHIPIYPEYLGYSGYHMEGNSWTAWDNSYGELAVESFHNKEFAKMFATELNLTHTEVHNLDLQAELDKIIDESKKEEEVLYKDTEFTDELKRDIMEYVSNEIEGEYIKPEHINEIASILQVIRDDEKYLLTNTPIVDDVIENISTFLNIYHSNAFIRSDYWRTFS